MHTNSATSSGGVGIYVSNNLHCQKVTFDVDSSDSGCEDIWVSVSSPNHNVNYVVGTIYRHPSSNPKLFSEYLDKVLTQLNSSNKYYFILGDININLNLTSSKITTNYLNTLNSNGVVSIINQPTRVTPSSATTIDHILTNETRCTLTPGVIEYDITDHYPTMVLVSHKQPSKQHKPKFARCFTNFTVKKFNDDLEHSLTELMSDISYHKPSSKNELNNIFDTFYSLITKTIDKHAPLKKLSRKKLRLQNNPWISKGLLISIKRKQKMHKTHYVNGTTVEQYFYKMYSNTLTKVKDLAKKNYYHNQLQISANNSKKTWKILHALLPTKPASSITNSLTVDNIVYTDYCEIANKFNFHFANIGKNLASGLADTDDNTYLSFLEKPCNSSIFLYPTSPYEVIMLINSLKLNKSSGHDDIHPFFLKVASNVIAYPLSEMINLCLCYGVFPDKLKFAKVIPVYKSGPKNHLNNYRPISLLPSLSKVLEKIIRTRMLSFFQINNILTSTQFGFRNKHSTIHPILDLITCCFDNLQNKQFSTMLFLDIRKAFDSVSHIKLIKKLQHYGIRGLAIDLLHSYLQDRHQYVSINNFQSTAQHITYGVPQGSILGPLLFLVYINDLPHSLQTIPRLFADDTALLISEDTLKKTIDMTNSELTKVNQWMFSNNLAINSQKTIGLTVSPSMHTTTPLYSIRLNNEMIKVTNNAKYLGVIFDNLLSFKPHIKYLEKSISRSVGIIAKLSYYLPTKSLITLYYSLVHSNLLYALPVWASTYKTYLTKLKTLQNKAIRIISKIPLKKKITPSYFKLKVLKLDDLYHFEIGKLMFQYTHKMLPVHFSNLFSYTSDKHKHLTRHSCSNSLYLSHFSSSRTQKSFKFAGAKIWNSIPHHIKQSSYSSFQKSYKEFLLKKYA